MTTSPLVADVIARVRLFSTEEGGRRTIIPATRFRCPVFFGEQRERGHDCVLLLDQLGTELAPGQEINNVPIKFLCREAVADKLLVGTKFMLWEGKDIGEGEILSAKTG